MKVCLCCKQNEIKHTFSFYCRWCCGYLQQRYGIAVMDYIIYFETMYNKIVPVDLSSYQQTIKKQLIEQQELLH